MKSCAEKAPQFVLPWYPHIVLVSFGKIWHGLLWIIISFNGYNVEWLCYCMVQQGYVSRPVMVRLCPARAFITLPPARACHLCHARAQRWFCYDHSPLHSLLLSTDSTLDPFICKGLLVFAKDFSYLQRLFIFAKGYYVFICFYVSSRVIPIMYGAFLICYQRRCNEMPE